MSVLNAVSATGSGRLRRGPRPPMSRRGRVVAAMGHHWAVYRRTWTGSIISRFLSPLFFLLSLGFGLGTLVDSHSGGVDGQSYLHFVVPGIVAYQAALVGFGESTYPVLGYLKWNKMYAATLASPLGVTDILLGHLLVIGFHVVMATGVFIAIAALFGSFTSWWVLLAVPIGLLVGWAFATPVFAVSASIENDNVFGILYRFLLTPILLFSGTFFPIDQLPGWLMPVAWVTPLWHGVVLMRAAAMGVWPGAVAWLHLAVILTFIVVGWVLAHRAFTRRLLS